MAGINERLSLVSVLLLSVCCVVASTELNQSDMDDIVAVHNDFRRTVARGGVKDKMGNVLPPAGNMMLMQWDGDLAGQAQTWADQCTIEHDKKKAAGTGENLAWGSDKNMSAFVQMWYDEIISADYTGGELPGEFAWPGMFDIGHFTQLAWARTGKVGCGLTECKVSKAHWFLVCRYAEQGNVKGQPLYETSENTCSQCEDKCDDDLCTELPPVVANTGTRCGVELGTDCPDWYCMEGTPFGQCTSHADGTVSIEWHGGPGGGNAPAPQPKEKSKRQAWKDKADKAKVSAKERRENERKARKAAVAERIAERAMARAGRSQLKAARDLEVAGKAAEKAVKALE